MITGVKCRACGKFVAPIKFPGSRNSTRGWSYIVPVTDGLCDECWQDALRKSIEEKIPLRETILKLLENHQEAQR